MAEQFEITRLFSAPRARVWDAWTRQDEIGRWLSPKGVKAEIRHFELKPGGYVHTRMVAPDGAVSWGKYIYREVQAPARLVWEQGFSNEQAEFVPAPFPMPWPLRMQTTVLLADEGAATKLSLVWQPVEPTPEQMDSFVKMLPSMNGGWSGTFDQLEALLAQTA